MKIIIAGLITIAIMGILIGFSAHAQQKPQGWEYKFQFQCNEKKANALAAEGWELVNMTSSGQSFDTAVNCAFKRPK